jgi:hypothetical protein
MRDVSHGSGGGEKGRRRELRRGTFDGERAGPNGRDWIRPLPIPCQALGSASVC